MKHLSFLLNTAKSHLLANSHYFAALLFLLLQVSAIKAQKPELTVQVGHHNIINSVSFSSNEKYLLSCSMDNTIKIWDVSTGLLIRTLEGHNHSVQSAEFSNNLKYVLSASLDKTIKLWDTETGNPIRSFAGHTKGVAIACFGTCIDSL